MPFVILMMALVLRSAWAIVQAVRGHGLEQELHIQ
jgi:hypothetical protein